MSALPENQVREVQSLAQTFFPDCRFTDPASLDTHDKGEIFHTRDKILPYLQTIFFEEHLVEIQVDQITRIFFAHIADDLPELLEEEDDEDGVVIVEPEYETGSYLKRMDSFLLTPLTPGIGNAQVRNSQKLVVRFFTGTIAIELGCHFRDQTMVRDVPVLRFDFPVIGRVNRKFRSFRVKAVASIDAKACFNRSTENSVSELRYPIVDVSAEGLAFQMPADQPPFEVGQQVDFTIDVSGIPEQEVCGNVRHITKARDKGGLKTICGVQYDLKTRSLAAELEKIAAAVQRLHLREIAERTASLEGVNLVR